MFSFQPRYSSLRPTMKAVLTILAALLAVFQSAQLFRYIDRYAVDVPFLDQWDFYRAFFEPHSLWQIFAWQHGPHRQGAGSFLIWLTNEWTGWDQRAQSFMIGAVMVCAALVALWLKRRLLGSFQWYDALPVLLILSWKSWEIYVNTPNVSHGAFPLLLVLLTGLCFTLNNFYLRYGLVVVLNFLTLFTGFGIFAGFIIPVLLLVALMHEWEGKRRRRAFFAGFANVISIASIGCFYLDYKFLPAVDCFSFPDPQWHLYPVFAAVEVASVILPGYSLSLPGRLIGLIALAALCMMLIWVAVQLKRQRSSRARYEAISFLLAFSLMFIASAAFGRICVGLEAAAASRYVPLMLPGMIGAYLFVLDMPQPCVRKYLLPILFCATAVTSVIPWNTRSSEAFRNSKAVWLRAYQETSDALYANSVSLYPIYPDPARTNLDSKLEWLRKRGYSLFRK